MDYVLSLYDVGVAYNISVNGLTTSECVWLVQMEYNRKTSYVGGYKTFFMLILMETKIYPAHKCLTFISRINDWLCWIKSKISINLGNFDINEQLRFHARLSWAWKKLFITLRPFGSLHLQDTAV